MEQLTLIEKRCIDLPPEICGETLMAAGSIPLNSMVVVGMELRERPDWYMRGYARHGDEIRRPLVLWASHARRWEHFFSAHMASVANHQHNSEEIIRFVLGMDIQAVHAGGPWPPLRCEPADYRHLGIGKGYSIVDKAGKSKDLVYGIDNPLLCLGSLGVGQPLFVAHTSDVLEFHQSDRMDEIIPEAPKRSPY